jgi:hypothetical protein
MRYVKDMTHKAWRAVVAWSTSRPFGLVSRAMPNSSLQEEFGLLHFNVKYIDFGLED